ncbi:MAG: hypothetical protein ULS35scaffold63_22 [Phage 33_17]|nr:MAG: hypothetical protein ULS35scaffold63_22 [Phage 33_17]
MKKNKKDPLGPGVKELMNKYYPQRKAISIAGLKKGNNKKKK